MAKGIITPTSRQISNVEEEIVNNASNVIYDPDTDTLQVVVGTKKISVYACGLNSAALIPVMTSNTTPKNSAAVTGTVAVADYAYKPFGNLPATASTGYAGSGYLVENTTYSSLVFTYEFDVAVNITSMELIPYIYRVMNYITWHAVTYTVAFIHEDGTKTTAWEVTTTGTGYGGGQPTPVDAYSLHSVDINTDNTYVKSIEITVSGPVFTYSCDTPSVYAMALNYFQVYGTVAQ